MRLYASIIAIAMLTTLIGCSSTTTPEESSPTLELIGTATDGELTISLYAERELEAGYNPVHLKVERANALVNEADITIDPLMDMGMMKHSCPVVQPGDRSNSQGMFQGAVIFTMAGTRDQWSLMIRVRDQAMGTTDSVRIPVDVAATSNVHVMRHEGHERSVATLVTTKWRVGMNDVQVMMHRTMDGFHYDPITDMTLKMVPTMPSMGHGSEGNVHPTHERNGLYQGRLNFTMSGDWNLELNMEPADGVASMVNFSVLVP